MNNSFDTAFKNLADCVANIGKGVEQLVDDIVTEIKPDKSTIVIKKGSKVFLGKGVYVELLSNVDARIIDEPAAESPKEE